MINGNSENEIPWKVFACVSLGVVMATLDASIVAVALPYIKSDLGAELSTVKWVMSVYLLVVTGLLLPMGRLADLMGQKRVFLGGLGIFTLGSLFCAAAGTAPVLIGARAAQGLGASMLMACAPAIITATFPPHMRGKGLGLIGTAVGFGLTAGPPLGGVLLEAFGWRSLFLINLPVGLGAMAYGAKRLPLLKLDERGGGFDLPGTALFMAATGALLFSVEELKNLGSEGAGLLAERLGVTVVLFALFLLWERRSKSPLIRPSAFVNRGFSAALSAALLTYMSGFMVVLLMPFYLTVLRGLSPVMMGLWLAIMPSAMMLAAPFAGALSDKVGYRMLTSVGLAVRTVGLVIFFYAGAGTDLKLVLLGFCLLGLGSAVFTPPNTSAIMGCVERSMYGVAGGLTAVARNMGMALGVALGGAMFSSRAPMGMEEVSTFMAGWKFAMGGAVTVCLSAFVISLLRGPDPEPEPEHSAGGNA